VEFGCFNLDGCAGGANASSLVGVASDASPPRFLTSGQRRRTTAHGVLYHSREAWMAEPVLPRSSGALDDDTQQLHSLGYAQELFRSMGGFQNFAISFTIISILAGCLTSYSIAYNQGGPVAITWGWLIVGFFCTLVALAMGEIASKYPTAGGLYFWASRLGSPAW
jgi:hypothetical protein